MSFLQTQFRPLALLGLLFLSLLLWNEWAKISCFALIIPFFAIWPIAKELYSQAIYRRRCIVSCVFQPESFWHFWLSKGLVVALTETIKAFGAGVILFASLLIWQGLEWLVFAIDLVILLLLYRFLQNGLENSLIAGRQAILLKLWTVGINIGIVLTGLTLVRFWSEIPPYIQQGLNATLASASHEITAQCTLIQSVAKLAQEIDALAWLTLLYASNNLQDQALKLVARVFFLASGGVAAWAYSWLVLGTVAWSDTLSMSAKSAHPNAME